MKTKRTESIGAVIASFRIGWIWEREITDGTHTLLVRTLPEGGMKLMGLGSVIASGMCVAITFVV